MAESQTTAARLATLETNADRDHSWLKELSVKVHDLELSKAQFVGAMFATSTLGSIVGGVGAVLISKFWH